MDAIVTSDQLSLIPRRVMYSEGMVEVQRSPSILALIVGGSQFDTMQQFLMSSFDREMKIIVLYDNLEELKTSAMILRVMKLFNVVYICTGSIPNT